MEKTRYNNLWSQSPAVNYQGSLYSVPKQISWYHHKEDGYSHRNHLDNLRHKDMLEIINSVSLMRIIANYHLNIFHRRANIDSKRFSNVDSRQRRHFEGDNEPSYGSQSKRMILKWFENPPHASWVRVTAWNAPISFFRTICFTLSIQVKVSRLSIKKLIMPWNKLKVVRILNLRTISWFCNIYQRSNDYNFR